MYISKNSDNKANNNFKAKPKDTKNKELNNQIINVWLLNFKI